MVRRLCQGGALIVDRQPRTKQGVSVRLPEHLSPLLSAHGQSADWRPDANRSTFWPTHSLPSKPPPPPFSHTLSSPLPYEPQSLTCMWGCSSDSSHSRRTELPSGRRLRRRATRSAKASAAMSSWGCARAALPWLSRPVSPCHKSITLQSSQQRREQGRGSAGLACQPLAPGHQGNRTPG